MSEDSTNLYPKIPPAFENKDKFLLRHFSKTFTAGRDLKMR